MIARLERPAILVLPVNAMPAPIVITHVCTSEAFIGKGVTLFADFFTTRQEELWLR